MTTRSIMLAEMADDMERSDSTAFTNKINAAIRHYQPTRFWFNESRSITFSTVDGTDTYGFGTDITTEFYTIDGVYIVEGGRQHCVRAVDYSDLETLIETTPQEGRPFQRAFINRSLRFYPCPDAVYTVRVIGHIKAAAPATDDEANNVWMTEAYDLIMSRAKAELYAHRYEDPNNAQIMRAAEEDALYRLNKAGQSKIGTGQIVPTQF